MLAAGTSAVRRYTPLAETPGDFADSGEWGLSAKSHHVCHEVVRRLSSPSAVARFAPRRNQYDIGGIFGRKFGRIDGEVVMIWVADVCVEALAHVLRA